MGLAPIKAPMGARVVIGRMEVLRTLDELEIEFPGGTFIVGIYSRITNYDFFTQQRRLIMHKSHLVPPERLSPRTKMRDHAAYILCHENPLQPQTMPE